MTPPWNINVCELLFLLPASLPEEWWRFPRILQRIFNGDKEWAAEWCFHRSEASRSSQSAVCQFDSGWWCWRLSASCITKFSPLYDVYVLFTIILNVITSTLRRKNAGLLKGMWMSFSLFLPTVRRLWVGSKGKREVHSRSIPCYLCDLYPWESNQS